MPIKHVRYVICLCNVAVIFVQWKLLKTSWKCRHTFTITNNIASSGLWENVTLAKINTYYRWHHWLCSEWHPVPKCMAPKWWCCRTTYLPNVEVVDTVWAPLHYLTSWCCDPCTVALLSEKVYLRCWSGVLNKTSSHRWDDCYFPMFLVRDGSLTLMYIAALMVHARVCYSLPRMEELSNLVWWPEVLLS